MAVISSIKKYTIDDIEIPVYPSSITPSHNLVSKSWNDMTGTFRDVPVNSKLKINWVFDYISERDLEILWGQIYNKIINKKTRFFKINTFFPGLGFISGTFYLGTPTSFSSKDWGKNGDVNWFSMELHWIEVDGIKLNSVTDVSKYTLNINGLNVKLADVDNDIINKIKNS